MPVQTDDMRKGNTDGSRKRRQRACKRSGEATTSPVYRYNKVKHSYDGEARTCSEIWHKCWRNGTQKPSRGKRKIRMHVAKEDEVNADDEEEKADDEGSPHPPQRARRQ
ncbi:hypothetical protein L917_02176 [Phytophthora nicotianae]|uniref:Uncharacterized protein n=1 Tax=Phytophthora nicotianae TaxID=4792 RepID=W2LX23_PHYNI|nr:hypothetical protein L917_02176 [Phytophthora nicotianae]